MISGQFYSGTEPSGDDEDVRILPWSVYRDLKLGLKFMMYTFEPIK